MNDYTQRRLEEFDELANTDYFMGRDFLDKTKSFITDSIAQALAEERMRMRKKNILNLIKYHAEKNESGFKNEAYNIARYFDSTGDSELAQYIMALLSDANTFVPQDYANTTGSYNSTQGSYALQNNTTGNNNSAQGVNALYANTTGYFDSAHYKGAYAIFSNTTVQQFCTRKSYYGDRTRCKNCKK